jgi:cation diffusion facilitator CzcD-associated flavoprotein CzcO
MPAADPPEYKVLNQFHSQPKKLKIIHVGAGASGLLTAYKARKWLTNYELICYEKNPTIGGTWYENRYPGCACDIPAHTYTFSFEPNPEWSGFYSYSEEIQRYMEGFYKRHELEPYMRFNTKVIEAAWNELEGKWEVTLEKDGETFTDKCDVLVNGSGVLTKWKWPGIEGMENYKGEIAHSAAWDQKIEWKDKRVAVIGTGSSSIQMVPRLAEGSKSLTIFARNMTWIAPQIASDVPAAAADGETPAPAGKHHYVAAEKERFRTDPAFFLDYRQKLEARILSTFPMFLRGSPINKMVRDMFRENMLAKLGPGHEEFKEKFIPQWSPGCRRLTPGEGYLETIGNQEHVKVVHGSIKRFTETGIETSSGQTFDFDLVACATGFEVSYVPHFKIIGTDGVVMQEEWADTPNIYCSIAAPNYPNYFVVNGPTGNWGQGCALPSHEVQIEYVMQCCKKMQEDNIKAMAPRQKPTTQINQHLDAWHRDYSVWAESCRSWYKQNKEDGRVFIWPGSMLHHLKTLRVPRFEHYEIEYHEDNMWAFLGNGRTELELTAEREGLDKVVLAPYIRNEDVPWSLDIPSETPRLGEKNLGEGIDGWKDQGATSVTETTGEGEM